MRLFRRDNGIWYVELRRNKWRSLKTKDKAEAEVVFKRVKREALLGKLVIMDSGKKRSLSEFIEEILCWYKNNRSYSTWDREKRSLKKLIDAFGNRPLSSIKKRDAEIFIDYCRRLGNSPVTINIELRHIKCAFSKAVEWEYIKRSPFLNVRQLKVQKKPPSYLTVEQIQSLSKIIDTPPYKELFAFYLYTGCRRSEILKLEARDINLKERVLYILHETKTSEYVVMPIILPLYKVINNMHLPKKGKIFNVSPFHVTHKFKEYFRKAGLPHMRLHDLRHTFASQLVMAGVDLKTVQELLGHTSFSTTQIYAHLSQEHLKKELTKLPY